MFTQEQMQVVLKRSALRCIWTTTIWFTDPTKHNQYEPSC